MNSQEIKKQEIKQKQNILKNTTTPTHLFIYLFNDELPLNNNII